MTPMSTSSSRRLADSGGADQEEDDDEVINTADEFFKDLDQFVDNFIQDCLQFDDNKGRDPRACHSFYQLISNHLQEAVNRGFLKSPVEFPPIWRKYDGWAAAAVEEYLNSKKDVNGSIHTFSTKATVIPDCVRVQHQLCKRNIENYMKETFLKSRNAHGQFNLADLKTRLDFFNKVGHYNADIMDHYWHRFLYSSVDQLKLYLELVKGQLTSLSKDKPSSYQEEEPECIMLDEEGEENEGEDYMEEMEESELSEMRQVVNKYKKLYGQAFRMRMKMQTPEIYAKFLTRERTLRHRRKAKYSTEKMNYFRIRGKIRDMRRKIRDSLRRQGVNEEEIERRILEKEREIFEEYNTNLNS